MVIHRSSTTDAAEATEIVLHTDGQGKLIGAGTGVGGHAAAHRIELAVGIVVLEDSLQGKSAFGKHRNARASTYGKHVGFHALLVTADNLFVFGVAKAEVADQEHSKAQKTSRFSHQS